MVIRGYREQIFFVCGHLGSWAIVYIETVIISNDGSTVSSLRLACSLHKLCDRHEECPEVSVVKGHARSQPEIVH